MRILLVEDHRPSAIATQAILRRHGYSVTVANDMTQARALCDQENFDLLLCDIKLPDGDGWKLMRELKQKCNIKGIALTACAYPADARRSEDAGFSAHVIKPFAIEKLLDAITTTMASPIADEADGRLS